MFGCLGGILDILIPLATGNNYQIISRLSIFFGTIYALVAHAHSPTISSSLELIETNSRKNCYSVGNKKKHLR